MNPYFLLRWRVHFSVRSSGGFPLTGEWQSVGFDHYAIPDGTFTGTFSDGAIADDGKVRGRLFLFGFFGSPIYFFFSL